MSDDDTKKPRIDLKARLGRTTVGTSGPSIPPPMATGASIPPPPFAAKAPEPEPEPVRAEPQAIKIEMSEEVVAAQKKGRGKVILIAVATALVGSLIGGAIGNGMERRAWQNKAVAGAEILREEVDAANVEIEKMVDILGRAKRSLSDGKYPEAEMNELADVQIPFGPSKLVGKGTGLMSTDVNNMLITFASKAADANDQKDKLKRVMGGQRKALEKTFAQAEKPEFNWMIAIVNGAHGPMATMEQVPEPFLVTSKEKVKDKKGKETPYAWPEEIEVPDGKKKIKLPLYKKGEALANPPVLFPVDPTSQGKVCSNDTMFLLRRELSNLEKLLAGDKSDPTNEKPGLVDTGDSLIDELKGIGGH